MLLKLKKLIKIVFCVFAIFISCKKSEKSHLDSFIAENFNKKTTYISFFISENDCDNCVGYIKEWIKKFRSKNLDIEFIGFYHQRNPKLEFRFADKLREMSNIVWKKLPNTNILIDIANKCNCNTPLLIKIQNNKTVYIKNISN